MSKTSITIQSMQHTFQHMQVIRFSLPNSPGMGHQATMVDIIDYIINLLEPENNSILPIIEVIYKDGKAAEKKLADLFSQANIHSDSVIQYRHVTIHFIDYFIFKNRLTTAPESIATANLLIIAGDPPHKYSNILEQYKAQLCTGIPAYQWYKQVVGYVKPNTLQRINGANKSKDMALPVREINRYEAAESINNLPAGIPQTALCRLFEVFERDEVYRQLIYGLADKHRSKGEIPATPRELTLTSLTIANLKRKSQAPIFMLFVNGEDKAKEDIHLIQQMINQGHCGGNPIFNPAITPALDEELASVKTNQFYAYTIDDPQLLEVLQTPLDNHVYMIHIPGLPKPLMHYWLVDRTTRSLPPVVEGANSINLLLNIDPAKHPVPPYLLASYRDCNNRNYPNQNQQAQSSKLSAPTTAILKDVVQALCPEEPTQIPLWTASDTTRRPPNVLIRFMAACEQSSELIKYFEQAATWHIRPENNKVEYAFKKVVSIQQAQQQASSTAVLSASKHDAMCATITDPTTNSAINFTDVPATLWCGSSTSAGLLALNPENKNQFMQYMQTHPNASMLVNIFDIPGKWRTVNEKFANTFREPALDVQDIAAPELVLDDTLPKAIHQAHIDLENLISNKQNLGIIQLEKLSHLLLYAIAFNQEAAVDNILKFMPQFITQATAFYDFQHTLNPLATLFAFGNPKLHEKIAKLYSSSIGHPFADNRGIMFQLIKYGTRDAYEHYLAQHTEYFDDITFIHTVLALAINYENVELTECLLKIPRVKHSLTINHLAQLCSRIQVNLAMLELLLPHFTPTEIEQSNIMLHQVGHIEKLSVIKLMVKHGVNLNTLKQYEIGSIPLYFLASNEDMLAELILLGADLRLKNQAGISPFSLKRINEDLNLALVYELLTLKNPEFAAKLDKSLFATPTTNTVHNDATELPRCIIVAEQGVSKGSALWNGDHQVKNADTRLHDTEQSTLGFTFFDPRNKQYADICINPLEVNALNPSPFSQAVVSMFGNPTNSESTHQASQNNLSNSH
ncbi:MAG: hypothetical protein Tsb005_13860 [Gammaproteobacteria bacterium]